MQKNYVLFSLLLLFSPLYSSYHDILMKFADSRRTVNEQAVIDSIEKIIEESSFYDEDGDTFFYTCCKEGYVNIAQKLIELGHSVNMRNRDGFLPIDAAAMAGQDAIVDLILAQKDVSVESNENGVTALHWAAKRGKKNIVAKLLDHGVNPNSVTHETNQTPLLWAASGGKDTPQRIRIALVESITRPPIKDYIEIINTLIAHGANVNHTTSLKFTPLHWALAYYNRDLARILIRHGADAHIKSDDGFIPLEMIQKEGDRQMLAEIDVVAKKELCLHCGQATTKKCSSCKLAYYCSAQCQRNAWNEHQSFCKQATTFDTQKIEVLYQSK